VRFSPKMSRSTHNYFFHPNRTFTILSFLTSKTFINVDRISPSSNAWESSKLGQIKISRPIFVERICFDSELISPPYTRLMFAISDVQHLHPRRQNFAIEMHGKLQNGAKSRFFVRFPPKISRSTENKFATLSNAHFLHIWRTTPLSTSTSFAH
jgi:hypothetical protein